jgi:hypothetical protein
MVHKSLGFGMGSLGGAGRGQDGKGEFKTVCGREETKTKRGWWFVYGNNYILDDL